MKIISPNYNAPKITTATESLEILHFESWCCRRFPFTKAITHGGKFNDVSFITYCLFDSLASCV